MKMKKENISEEELDDLLDRLSKSATGPTGKYSAGQSYSQLEEKILSRNKKRFPLFKYVAAASVAIIFILSAYTLFIADNTEMVTVATNNNTQEIILPDGSQITLSHYSILQYPSKFGKDSREVIMLGEAYFDITKDKEHPFIVHTDNVQIKVLGTKFNVESYPKDDVIKTTLIEGKVAVSSLQNDDSVILNPNETAYFDKGSENMYKASNHNAINELAWREGKHIFNNQTLLEITQELSNYFNIHIEINNQLLKEYRLTAHFEQNEDIEDILNILETAASFRWEKDNNTIVIISND